MVKKASEKLKKGGVGTVFILREDKGKKIDMGEDEDEDTFFDEEDNAQFVYLNHENTYAKQYEIYIQEHKQYVKDRKARQLEGLPVPDKPEEPKHPGVPNDVTPYGQDELDGQNNNAYVAYGDGNLKKYKFNIDGFKAVILEEVEEKVVVYKDEKERDSKKKQETKAEKKVYFTFIEN